MDASKIKRLLQRGVARGSRFLVSTGRTEWIAECFNIGEKGFQLFYQVAVWARSGALQKMKDMVDTVFYRDVRYIQERK